jgi:hypothetical protein
VTRPGGPVIISLVLPAPALSVTLAVPMFATTTSTFASAPLLYAIGWSFTTSTGVGAGPASSVK